jgi:hypothetical protein
MVKKWLIFITTTVHFYKFDAEITGGKFNCYSEPVKSSFSLP